VAQVMQWPIVSPLTVRMSGDFLQSGFKAPDWPSKEVYGVQVYANPWVAAKIGGRWQCATWEWMRRGGESKRSAAVAGDHVKRADWPNGWRPASGERLWFFVSSLARHGQRTVNQRTGWAEVTWP